MNKQFAIKTAKAMSSALVATSNLASLIDLSAREQLTPTNLAVSLDQIEQQLRLASTLVIDLKREWAS